jgi:iron complex outermembrane receptor protein
MAYLNKASAIAAAVALLANGVASMPAQAQAAPGQSDALEEVVVTAERREANIQTTAIAIQAVSGDTLAEAQINTMSDLQKAVPTLTVNQQGISNLVTIRGIGMPSLTPAISPGVAIMYDGLFAAESQGIQGAFYDLADVEILRGPQGTLVGMAAIGGAMQINSKKPDFNGVSGFASALVGDYSDHKLTAAINLPISDTFAARIAANMERRGSFYHNLGTRVAGIAPTAALNDPGSVNDEDYRISLLWKPSESFQSLLRYEYTSNDNGGPPQSPNQSILPDGSRSPYYAYSTHVPFLLNYSAFGENWVRDNRVGWENKWTLSNGIVLRSMSGVQLQNISDIEDADGSAASNICGRYTVVAGALTCADPNFFGAPGTFNVTQYNQSGNRSLSQEFSVASAPGRLNWITGASVFYRKTPLQLNLLSASIPVPIPIWQISTQRNAGVFANVNWKFTDTLELQVGARENWDSNFVHALPTFLNGFNDVPSYGKSTSVPTGKIGLNWNPVAGQFIYAFYARGYKPGGQDNAQVPPFTPEHLNDFELGIKSDFFEHHLSTQLGGYYMKYADMQQTNLSPTAKVAATTVAGRGVVNVGGATIKGIEASLQAKFGGFGADLSAAFSDSKLEGFNVYPSYALPPAALPLSSSNSYRPQCAAGVPDTAATVNGAGNGYIDTGCFNYQNIAIPSTSVQNTYSPKVSVNAGIDYGFGVGGDAILRPRVSYSYVSKQFADLAQTTPSGAEIAYYMLQARSLLNFSLTLTTGPWDVQAFVNNLGDKTYISSTNGNNIYYGAPRQMGVRFNRTF